MDILHLNQRNQRNQILFQYLRDEKKIRKKRAQKKGGGVKIRPFHLPWIRACRHAVMLQMPFEYNNIIGGTCNLAHFNAENVKNV